MATDTYIEMVSHVILETGLNGGNAPSSIEGASGDAAKVCYWVRVADMQIQRERIDWRFLWGVEDALLTEGSAVVPAPFVQPDPDDPNTRTVLINTVPKDRLAIINPNGEAYFPTFLDWNDFSLLYGFESQQASDYPTYWSLRPTGEIVLSEPIESPNMVCRYEYWRKPVPLRVATDTSPIPDDFSRLIVLLAKVLYAEHEDAPEVDIGSTAQYETMLNQMIAVEAPQAEWQRLENSDRPYVVETR